MQIGGASMILPTLKTQVGMIPAQTQLQTALSINLGSDGKAVSFFLQVLYNFEHFWSYLCLILAHI